MNGIELIGEESPRKLQELARHQMIVKLYQSILMDMQICEIEGWDKMEFINQIRQALDFAEGESDDTRRSVNTFKTSCK